MPAPLFWLLFFVAAAWGQFWLPGLDILAAGIIVALQEEGPTSALWLAGFAVLLQEGAGSLAFGSAVLIYASMLVLYALGRWLFEGRNLLFIVLLGAGTAVVRLLLIVTMARLQGGMVLWDKLLTQSLWQIFAFPVIWFAVSLLHKHFVRHRHDPTFG